MNGSVKTAGAIGLGWWSANLGNRDRGGAKALAARLRRATPVEVLSERAVHDLARQVGLGASQAGTLMRLACLLAEVRTHVPQTLAQRLGGGDPVLSELRFQRLLRAEGDELVALLRRAIVMADRQCNVAALVDDLLHWEADHRRARWCFHYFGAAAPFETDKETDR